MTTITVKSIRTIICLVVILTITMVRGSGDILSVAVCGFKDQFIEAWPGEPVLLINSFEKRHNQTVIANLPIYQLIQPTKTYAGTGRSGISDASLIPGSIVLTRPSGSPDTVDLMSDYTSLSLILSSITGSRDPDATDKPEISTTTSDTSSIDMRLYEDSSVSLPLNDRWTYIYTMTDSPGQTTSVPLVLFSSASGANSGSLSTQASDSTVANTEATSGCGNMVATPLPQTRPNLADWVIRANIKKLEKYIDLLKRLSGHNPALDHERYGTSPSIAFAFNDLYSCIALMMHTAESCKSFYQEWLATLDSDYTQKIIIQRLHELLTAAKSAQANQTNVEAALTAKEYSESQFPEISQCKQAIGEVFQLAQALLKELQPDFVSSDLDSPATNPPEQEAWCIIL